MKKTLILFLLCISCAKENTSKSSNNSAISLPPPIYRQVKPLSGFVCVCVPDSSHYRVTLQISNYTPRTGVLWLLYSADQHHVTNYVQVPYDTGFVRVFIYHPPNKNCGEGAGLYCTLDTVPIVGDTIRGEESHGVDLWCTDCSLCAKP